MLCRARVPSWHANLYAYFTTTICQVCLIIKFSKQHLTVNTVFTVTVKVLVHTVIIAPSVYEFCTENTEEESNKFK